MTTTQSIAPLTARAKLKRLFFALGFIFGATLLWTACVLILLLIGPDRSAVIGLAMSAIVTGPVCVISVLCMRWLAL